MIKDLKLRTSTPDDIPAIETVYLNAFPSEDLCPLVRSLLKVGNDVMSFVATAKTSIIGHAIFTKCRLANDPMSSALLGPIAVAPQYQRQGAGRHLVQHGLQTLKDQGTRYIFVLGDPNYYQHFGFTAEPNVTPPYALPEEWRTAWQSLKLDDDERTPQGTITLPNPWLRKELWQP